MLTAPAADAAAWDVPCGTAWLVAAVETANGNPGPDTLNLAPGCIYTFSDRYNDTEWALPSLVEGLTINGGGATVERDDASPSMGLARVPGDLLLSNVTLREFWGFDGAYFSVSGSLVLDDGMITNTPPYGQQEAAIKVKPTGALAVIDSTFEHQVQPSGGFGSAIENQGTLTVVDSVFRNNGVRGPLGTSNAGGAIGNLGSAEIFGSMFTDNESLATGGAISNRGDLKVHDSTFEGGTANFGGAISTGGDSDLLVERSYFASNNADIAGGAIDSSGDSITTVRSSSFYRNTAGRGGALSSAHSTRVEWSTFSRNTATGDGDTLAGPTGLIAVQGSVLSGGGDASHCSGNIANLDHNVVFPVAGSCPGTFAVGDPKLTAPALLGGSTPTMALGVGSAANDTGGTGCPSSDQRGLSRPAGPACDIGAVENQLPAAATGLAVLHGSAPRSDGQLVLTWDAAGDAESDTVVYRLYRQDADDPVATLIGTFATDQAAVQVPEGTQRFTLESFDGSHASTAVTLPPLVVDLTAPSAPTAAADRAPDYVAGDGTGWYGDRVAVSFSASSDPDLADTSPGSGVATTAAPEVFTTSGAHTATGHATDHAGNSSAAASLTAHVDADAPIVGFDSCPATVLLGSTTDLAWTASDGESGLVGPAAGTVQVDTTTIGERILTADATDNVGHHTTTTCALHVIYDFTGFFAPATEPTTVSAGAALQLSFSLHGNRGLAIVAAGYPTSAQIPCGTSPQLTTGQPTSALNPGLGFAPGGTGRYTYHWKTTASWGGSCRQFVLKLDDGTYHRANVRFR